MSHEPIEGDVFRFTYSEETRAKWRTDPWHCFDGQLVFKDGRLHDTYWGGLKGTGDSRSFTVAEAHAQGTLTFVVNINDLNFTANAQESQYYDPADWFNLSYQRSCYSLFGIRKGAVKSQAQMLASIDAKIVELDDQARRYQRWADQLREIRVKIAAGDTEVRFS